VAFLLLLEIHGHPDRYARLIWGAERTICALGYALSCEAFTGRSSTEIKAVFSMDMRGIISMSCWQAMSSSSGGVTDARRAGGRDMDAVVRLYLAICSR
jgi:hypothetical protein